MNEISRHALSDPFHGLDIVIPENTRKRLVERAEPWRDVLPARPLRDTENQRRGIERRGVLPGRRRSLAIRSVCRMVGLVATEMVFLIGERPQASADRRFALGHIQQISMYICHVVLQLTMTEIGLAFGRDRTTVGHACARVEDRRDDHAYDHLVASVERVVGGLFAPVGASRH